MSDTGSILLRRGPTADRLAFVPLDGEIIYDSDLKQVFIGDGITYGGRAAGGLNDGVFELTNASVLKFYEASVNGNNAVSVSSPTNLPGSYDLKLPPTLGADGTILGVGANGQLEFVNPDSVGGNAIYVSTSNGNDANNGISKPVKTIKRALQLASGFVYNSDGSINGTKIAVNVAAGDYYENNPIIVPDNVTVKGASLRACNLRPLNANKDFLRVRSASYFSEFTFRDALDINRVPVYTWDYSVSFDNPSDTSTSRVGYTNLPATKPTIDVSPYIQNCSIISFLGGNGALVDGNLVVTPNNPNNQIQVENPVDGPAPEQGHSMVANAFTMLTFGGTAWRVINDAYIQIVSCFQIFALNGTYAQSGGYASITNSATNFGTYALRASGYSPNAFSFDKGYVTATGVNNSLQSITAIGFGRLPTQDYVIKFRDPTFRYTFDLLKANRASIISQTSTWIDLQITNGTAPFAGYNYSGSNRVKGERDIGLSIDAVMNDVITGGNSNSVAAGLSYQKLASDIYAISSASIAYAKGLAQTAVSSLTGKSTVVGNYFDIITNAITSPSTAPVAVPYGTASDITSSFVPLSTSYSLNAATNVNITSNVITITGHGFNNGDGVIYDSDNGTAIGGLSDEQKYYIDYLNENTFRLCYDESLAKVVDITSVGAGTQYFIKNLQEFFIKDLITSHNSYQTLTLASGSYTFTPGSIITGSTTGNANDAYIYSYNPITRELVVSLNQVTVNASVIRNPFAAGSTIITNDGIVSNISVTGVASKSDLYTGVFTIQSTSTGGTLSNLVNLPKKIIWLHRPSIVNSSGHTWEFAGSGTDYNALPQNGGQTIFAYEQVSDLPGRVYSSGTNELGDFKVGNFIKAENRTGNVSFTNKVSVAQLDALRLAVGNIVIDFISNDIGLGDNEAGGASDNHLTTQLAIRSFLSNRLGNFIDKSVSTNAVPGSVIQLNSSGQINVDLLPAVRNFNSAKAFGYNSRLSLLEEVPATDLLNGDIVSETYSTVQLTLSGTITATAGTLITQATTNASGYLTTDVTAASVVTVASYGDVNGQLFNINFNTTAANVLTVGGVVTARYPTAVGTALTGNTANYVLINSNEGQYLILPSTGTYGFTVGNVITSANDLIQGRIASTKFGVVKTVDAATYTPGTGYTPASGTVLYSFVPLTGGTGTGAVADITVTNGVVVNIDLRRGGTGYAVGNVLSVAAANIGGTVTTACAFPVTSIENRLYVTLLSGTKFTATNASPNFIADNNASNTTLAVTASNVSSFNAGSTNIGGAVDSDADTLTITSHGLTNGDPVTYSSGVNVALGGIVSGNVYYIKVINANTVQLYKEYSLSTVMNITSSASGTHTLTTSAVNVIGNVIYLATHGYTTGDCIQLTGSSLPAIDAIATVTGTFYFIGSVTTNSFTLHTSRSDALSSVNGLATLPVNFTSTGSGNANLKKQNVFVYGVINTSSTNANNWSPLSTSTIDAGSIISGIVGTTRLATGSASSSTFLRGDQSWKTAVQSIKKASGSPLTPTGSYATINNENLFYGDVTLDVDKVNSTSGDDTYTNLGVAKFLKSQFNVGTSTTAGQVYIKDNVIDAGTLQSYNAAYFLNPSNLSKAVPVNKGGTALSTYAAGDILYASDTATLSTLTIGDTNKVLTVNTAGNAPQWSESLSLAGSLTVAGNLTVNGLTTTFNTSTLTVDDKNIELGSVVTKTGLTATLVSGNYTVTLTSTSGLVPGMTITKTAGTGVFGASPVISTVDSATQITLNVLHVTNGAVTFTAGAASDATANGGGITLKGTTDKTIIWDSTNSNWTSSEHWNIATDKAFKINNTSVLNATTLGTAVVTSSLTTVGTIGTGTWQGTTIGTIYGGTGLTSYAKGDIIYASASNTLTVLAKATETSVLQIDADGTLQWNKLSSANAGVVTTGTWNGSVILGTYGGTGVANTNKTITLGGNLTTSGAFATTLTVSATTSVTLPTSGTLVGSADTGTVSNAMLANSKITINGNDVSLGGSLTVTATAANALTIGTGLSGTSFNGSAAVTIAIDDTVVTKTGEQTLTNKTLTSPSIGGLTLSDASIVFEGATANDFETTLTVTDPTADRTITLPNVTGTVVTTGDTGSVTNDMLAGSIATSKITGTFGNSRLTNSSITVGSTVVSLGDTITALSGMTTISTSGNITIGGNLTVNGTTTTINSNTLTVDDKNIELGSVVLTNTNSTSDIVAGENIIKVASTAGYIIGQTVEKAFGSGALGANAKIASIDSATQFTVNVPHVTSGSLTVLVIGGADNFTANGGGITLKGTTDKTIVWDNTNSNWTSSEHWNIPNSKTFKINNTTVLSATQVLGKAIGGTAAGDIVDLDTNQTLTNKTLSSNCTFPALPYLSAEADTLDTVTGRGASTSTASTFSGGITTTKLTVDSWIDGATNIDLMSFKVNYNGDTFVRARLYSPASSLGTTEIAFGNAFPDSNPLFKMDVRVNTVEFGGSGSTNGPTMSVVAGTTAGGAAAKFIGKADGVTGIIELARTSSSSYNPRIGVIANAGSTYETLVFQTAKASTYVDRMTIDTDGLVTIVNTLKTTAITTGASTTAGTIVGDWSLTGKWQATYADLAEYYEADADYEPGTVVELGGEKEVTLAEDSTCRVAGVVSTNPAYLMNKDCMGKHIVAIALQGRVPVKVRGRIRKGDFLVSGGNGFARPSATPVYGSVIGKAIENFDGGEGVIEVMIGRT